MKIGRRGSPLAGQQCKGALVGLHFGSALLYTKSGELKSSGNLRLSRMHLFCKYSFCAYAAQVLCGAPRIFR